MAHYISNNLPGDVGVQPRLLDIHPNWVVNTWKQTPSSPYARRRGDSSSRGGGGHSADTKTGAC
jgi:hypothetical protein